MNEKKTWEFAKSARKVLISAAEVLNYQGAEMQDLKSAVFRKGNTDLTPVWRLVHALLRESLHLPDDDKASQEAVKIINKVTHSYQSGRIPK